MIYTLHHRRKGREGRCVIREDVLTGDFGLVLADHHGPSITPENCGADFPALYLSGETNNLTPFTTSNIKRLFISRNPVRVLKIRDKRDMNSMGSYVIPPTHGGDQRGCIVGVISGLLLQDVFFLYILVLT